MVDREYNEQTLAVEGIQGCPVFCLWVPEGRELDIRILDFTIDLDLYVDKDLSSLMSQSIDEAKWVSNAYGTGDERISISNPDGRYYIQVCSYEELVGGVSLYASFSP